MQEPVSDTAEDSSGQARAGVRNQDDQLRSAGIFNQLFIGIAKQNLGPDRAAFGDSLCHTLKVRTDRFSLPDSATTA
jgi:hypothetical protein